MVPKLLGIFLHGRIDPAVINIFKHHLGNVAGEANYTFFQALTEGV